MCTHLVKSKELDLHSLPQDTPLLWTRPLTKEVEDMIHPHLECTHAQCSTYPSICEVRDYRILSFSRHSQTLQSSDLNIRGHTHTHEHDCACAHTHTHKILPAQFFMTCHCLWFMRSETMSQPRSPSSTPFSNQVFPQLKLKLP